MSTAPMGTTAHPPAAASSATRRVEAQRQRILDAAQRCFIAQGFHAASIGDIAGQAGISQGLVYRYFESKRAMLLAVIEQQLEKNLQNLEQMRVAIHRPQELIEGLLANYPRWGHGHDNTTDWNPVLFGEIAAEALRDPLVAEVQQRFEDRTRDAILAWLRQCDTQAGRSADETTLQWRALLLRVLVEGLGMRAMRQPDLPEPLLRTLLEQALPPVFGE